MLQGDVGSSASFDWQRELENLSSRMNRNRSEEAATMRRSAEEAERAVLRRIEDSERRLLRCQEEDVSSLQSFLSNWNSALDVRFEKQRSQASSRLDVLEKRADEEAECLRSLDDVRMEMQKTAEAMGARLAGLEEEILKASEASFETLKARMQEGLGELRRELHEQASSQNSSVQQSLLAFTERVEAVETTAGAARSELEAVMRRVNEKVDGMQQASQQVRQDLAKNSSDVETLRERMETSHQNVRQVVENSEKRTSDSVTELRALRGHCEGRLESQARTNESLSDDIKERCRSLESELREMISDATSRAELHAANLDSKVAGALDAVMDARVVRGVKECSEEVACAKHMLEARLRSSETYAEKLLKEESAANAAMASDFAQLRQEMRSHLTDLNESSENLQAVTGRISSDVRRMQTYGLSHEWCIPRCLHRIRYLSMSTEAGLWLDSDSFSLGTMGPLTLRLYPRGVRGGDGQCAVGLRMEKEAVAACGLYAVPTCVDLAVGSLRSRAHQRTDDDGGGVIWLAEGLGDVENHAAKSGDDLMVKLEVPQLQVVPTGSVDAAAGLSELLTAGVAESMTVPQELQSALQQRSRMSSIVETGDSSQDVVADLAHSSHLLSQETLLRDDDLASTVTVGSDSNVPGRHRTQWTEAPRQGYGSSTSSTAGVSSLKSGHSQGVTAGTHAPSGPSGVFAVQSNWSQFPDSTGGRSNLAAMLGSSGSRGPHSSPTASSSSVPAGVGSVPGRSNPFDGTNPFDSSFREREGVPLVGSPTPSFATAPDNLTSNSVPVTNSGAPGIARLRGEVPAVSPV